MLELLPQPYKRPDSSKARIWFDPDAIFDILGRFC
jgi:hypothetical protein